MFMLATAGFARGSGQYNYGGSEFCRIIMKSGRRSAGARVSERLLIAPADLEVGASILVAIPGLEMLPARVRWKSGFTYGCKFERELYPAVFDHIVQKAR